MSQAMDRLLQVMAQLRSPGGCPWDLEQTFASIAPHTLEEAYEVVEAVENGDRDALCDELGDLLLQVIFYAQIAKEEDSFDFNDVAARQADKLIERHPHVFGDRQNVNTAGDVLHNWEADKAAKREARAQQEKRPSSILDGMSTALPSTTRALKLQKRLARVGFDWKWKDLAGLADKIREESLELKEEIKKGTDRDAIEDELGDLFFVLVNLARHLEIDPETALRRTNRKVERRFHKIEERLAAQGRTPSDASFEEMDSLWAEVKKTEKKT